MLKPVFIFPIFFVFILLTSCKEEHVPDLFQPSSAHEAYIYGLKQAKLLDSQLGRQFITAADEALEYPIDINTPYQEQFFLNPAKPKALGYLFYGIRGEKINIEIEPGLPDSSIIFIDLFRIDSIHGEETLTHIASANETYLTLGYEPRQDNRYILRIQTELLHGGNYSLSIINKASFDFPVTGKDRQAIGSFFGDPRDGGRRKHHGIDIFAARHTPIISPSSGIVRFAGEKGLGGRVVWLRDQVRERTLYFAHLEDIWVETGDQVEVGDTVGTVGNTGNARTTPPHLHFGIYQRGPIDPYNFVANQRPKLKRLKADNVFVGKLGRLNRADEIPIFSVDTTIILPKYQIVMVEAAFENKYRVRLPNNQYGHIHASRIEPIDAPIDDVKEYTGHVLYEPEENSIILDSVNSPTNYQVLGIDQDYRLVQNRQNQMGWITTLDD